MMRGPSSTILLARALFADACLAGTRIEIDGSNATAWHSATFSGARHALDVTAPVGGDTSAWVERIGDVDLSLPGHLLAELSVTRSSQSEGKLRLRIEALTVDDCDGAYSRD